MLPKHRKPPRRGRTDTIISVDGEGITDIEGTPQRYTLLAASTGMCVKSDSLSTTQCFDFLLSLPQRSLIVGYGLNYDVNMWIKDIDVEHLQELWETGHTTWRKYSIAWHPHKMFSIGTSRRRIPYLKHDGKVSKRVVYEQHVTIWDVLGFFQSKFVEALEFWNVGTTEQWDTIARMKDKRSAFTDAEKLEIEAYCFTECELLVTMVQKLLEYTDKLGLKLTRYDGAGAIAAAMMRKHRVKDYIAEPPVEAEDAVMRAYIGGRFETSMIGTLQNAYAYDVNSAYPTQTLKLPCLVHGQWKQTSKLSPTSLLHVRWNLCNVLPIWGPFPFRNPDGSIVYPMAGEGWYWGAEVAAASRLYPGRIKILEGYLYEQSCTHKPFEFVSSYYQLRKQLKATNDFGQIIIKLGLNSLYGKCAQSVGGKVVGYTEDGTEIHARPTYQSFVWAGMITSGTRAAILDAIRLGNVVSIATDGVISKTPIPLEVGDELGTWDYAKIEQFTSVQNGVYRYAGINGAWKVRARGFSGREFNFDDLLSAFQRDREHAQIKSGVNRFVGIGSALHRAPVLADWRVWIRQIRTIKLHPENRTLTKQWGIRDNRNMVTTRAWHGVDGISHPYKPKTVFRHLSDGVELQTLPDSVD